MLPGLQRTGPVVVVHGLSFSEACEIFLELEMEPTTPALAGGFFTTEPSGKPSCILKDSITEKFKAVHGKQHPSKACLKWLILANYLGLILI